MWTKLGSPASEECDQPEVDGDPPQSLGDDGPFAAAFRRALDGLAVLALDGRFLKVNRALCETLGRPERDLLAMTVRDILCPDDLTAYLRQEQNVRSGEADAFHACLRCLPSSGEPVWVDFHQSLAYDREQRPQTFVVQIRDVTRSREAERQHIMVLKTVEVLRSAMDIHAAAESLLEVIQSQTGIEAAGIRVARKADFRYIAHKGFPPEFILAEDSLCAQSEDGALLCRPDGTPCLACTCGLVIEGRTDATDPLYSPRGSAWTNDAVSIPHLSPSLAQRLHPRDLCLKEGYRSIALIPIKAGAVIVGLLQLNDRRPGRFSPEKIAFLEDLAASFGILFGRLNTENRLHASVAHLNLAFEAAKAGSWEWNPRTGENRWSDSLWALYGLDPQRHHASYETWLSVIHPDDRASAERSVQETAQSGGADLNAEWRVCLPSGETRWLMSRGRPIRDAQGHFDRYVGVTVDIDERKRAEEVLRETERRYDQVSEHNRTITWEVDASGLYTYICRVSEIVLGYRPDEIVGKRHFYDLHPEKDREKFKEASLDVFARKAAFVNFDNRCQTKDEHVLWMRTSGLPTLDANGDLLGYRGIDVDVTAQKQIEDAQAFLLTCGLPSTGEDFFASLARYLAQSLNANGVCIDRLVENGKTARALAFCANGETRRDVCHALADSPGGAVCAHTYQAYAQGLRASFSDDALVQQLSAESYAGIALRDSSGHAIGLIAVMGREPLDNPQTEALLRLVAPRAAGEIERRRVEEESGRLQAQLSQAQKMESVGRLAGGVAHDFNNMLGVIIGNAELAWSDMAPAATARDNIQEILKAAKRSTDLTRQLLVFARKQTVQPQVIDLNQTIAGTLKMLGRLIGEDIELGWCPHIEAALALIDPTQVDQILANLVINARDAITKAGRVVIETDRVTVASDACVDHADAVPGAYILLTVSDNGCGMDPETLTHIFEPFFTTKRIGTGTGLGLSTVYGIVKQNRGFILVHSEPGKGSTFKVHLPFCADGNKELPAPADQPTAAMGNETVLLVEDEAELLNTSARILRTFGYRVLSAPSSDEALLIAANHPGQIDLLITDIVMPGMNGLALSKELLARLPGIKCLFMSGYTADVVTHRTRLPPGAKLIEKPFTRNGLGRVVREILNT